MRPRFFSTDVFHVAPATDHSPVQYTVFRAVMSAAAIIGFILLFVL